MAIKQMNIKIEEALIKEIKHYAIDNDMLMRDVVSKAVRFYMNHYEEPKAPVFRLKNTEYKGKF